MNRSAGPAASPTGRPHPWHRGLHPEQDFEQIAGLRGGHERILLVDDEPLQASAVGRLLSHLGYQVMVLTDPVEALKVYRRDPDAFDLVILDQTMPRLTGGELATAILAVRPEMPIVLCTGYSEDLDEDRAAVLGIRAFLWKPFSSKELAETLRRLFQPAA